MRMWDGEEVYRERYGFLHSYGLFVLAPEVTEEASASLFDGGVVGVGQGGDIGGGPAGWLVFSSFKIWGFAVCCVFWAV